MHASVCDLITDLVQNAIEAHAEEIMLNVEETEKNIKVVIQDNGKGMSAETLEKAKNPFWSDGKHRHRKVGLGLPFLFQTVDMTDGSAEIQSEEGVGTTVTFNLDPQHVDLPMFGNFVSTAVSLMTYEFDGNLTVQHSRNSRSYSVSKNDLTDALGNLNNLENMVLLKQFIQSNEEELR
ncbi:ATP-binding protein [Pontiella agarivorans]|uniref:histidine kinase n=1 Tax=Pontiella agarivorans TaxID=3038953 RepID=A0ABU5MUF2_9BACT|nr:ATP-binding protein [Pontiella agarivorans]MDZ8117845.1 ATP-binding protein [Pontiella agarivorans]